MRPPEHTAAAAIRQDWAGRSRPQPPSSIAPGRQIRSLQLPTSAAIASSLGHFNSAAVLTGVVFMEVLVLAFNAWRCPLTDMAARHTDARQANFDIYLPQWLARYNKEIFGTWYVGGCVVALTQWLLA
jgi:hypothetical protein